MSARATVAPLILGPANSESATGWPWRFVKERARALGVPVLGSGKKQGVSASAFLAALERAPALDQHAPSPLTAEQAAEQVRAMLGKARLA